MAAKPQRVYPQVVPLVARRKCLRKSETESVNLLYCNRENYESSWRERTGLVAYWHALPNRAVIVL